MTRKDRTYLKLLAILVLLLLLALALTGCAGLQRHVDGLLTPSNAERVVQAGEAAKIAGALVPGPVGDILSYGGYGLVGLVGVYLAAKKRQAKNEAAKKAAEKEAG